LDQSAAHARFNNHIESQDLRTRLARSFDNTSAQECANAAMLSEDRPDRLLAFSKKPGPISSPAFGPSTTAPPTIDSSNITR
jgi:hypothetical protein